MHPSPVRTGIGFATAVAVSFQVVLASGHYLSLSVCIRSHALPCCRMLDVARLFWPARRGSGDQSSPHTYYSREHHRESGQLWSECDCTLFRNGVKTSLLLPKAGP